MAAVHYGAWCARLEQEVSKHLLPGIEAPLPDGCQSNSHYMQLLRLPSVADNAAMHNEPPNTDLLKRKHRWLQCSLRTLLIVVTLLALRTGQGALAGERTTEEEIAEIQKLHGWIVRDEQSPGGPVIQVEFSLGKLTDADLKHLKGFTKLQRLSLNGTRVTDAGLEQLQGLIELQTLLLSGTKVKGPGLEHLKGLTKLQTLNLGFIATDGGLEHVEGLTQLRRLDLTYSKITDEGLVHVQGLTKLQRLELASTKVTGPGLEHIKGLTELQRLELWDTQLKDAGLEHLKGLAKLQTLLLSKTQITDAGLKHLQGLTQLRTLSLSGTHVTDAGVNDLQKALPNCKIEH